MVFPVDHHYGGSSAVMAAPHPHHRLDFHHSPSDMLSAIHSSRMESAAVGAQDLQTALVSPRISSAAKKRKEGLAKKHQSITVVEQHNSGGSARSSRRNPSVQSSGSQVLSLLSSTSTRSIHHSEIRSSRGAQSVQSFDPADLSVISSQTESVRSQDEMHSYGSKVLGTSEDRQQLIGVEDGVELEGIEEEVDVNAMYHEYCEDEVDRMEPHHRYPPHEESFDDEEEYEIPEELVSGITGLQEHSTHMGFLLHRPNHEDDGDVDERSRHEAAVHRLLAEDDDASGDEASDVQDDGGYDYDENDDAGLALSSVCSSPRRDDVGVVEDYYRSQRLPVGAASHGASGTSSADDYDPMQEVRAALEVTDSALGTIAPHPFLAMDQQHSLFMRDRNDLHQQFCTQHYQQQQVSLLDRTTMIRALLFEAHRHQVNKLQPPQGNGSSAGSTPTTSTVPSGMNFDEDYEKARHKEGWRAIAADVDRTMTMEGPMSAQRKLSCMCIFNPHRAGPPVIDAVDEERLRRMTRQEAILKQIYQRTDNVLFAEQIREGVSTPHPFASSMPRFPDQPENSSDDYDLLFRRADEEGFDQDEEEEDAPRLAYEVPEPISIPLPSYSFHK